MVAPARSVGPPFIGLILAGWDPSAGAGAAADLKTFAAHGVYGEAVLTALTVQNTQGVFEIQPVRAAWIRAALTALSEDNSFSVIKIGMLSTPENVRIAIEFVRQRPQVPLVLDPVLRASSGAPLLELAGLKTFISELAPLSSWLTPNLDELAALTETKLPADVSPRWIENQGRNLTKKAPQTNIFITGGHLEKPDDLLILASSGEAHWIPGERIETRATHGTGCTLSSAIAARLARWPNESAVETATAAKRYVEGAIRNAPGIGRGAGPLEHFWQK
jgi:hydroxymethylpyrimidine/phosphomethylpyrimidine kinase